jgi:hypothetical protein
MQMPTYENAKTFINNKKGLIAAVAVSLATSIATVAADISSDLNNFSQIIGYGSSGFTGYFVSMMGVFMQPPLVYFVVLGIFVTFVHLAGSFLMKRGKK